MFMFHQSYIKIAYGTTYIYDISFHTYTAYTDSDDGLEAKIQTIHDSNTRTYHTSDSISNHFAKLYK